MICAIDSGGVKPSMSVEGAVDGKAFEGYVEHLLAPKLKRGQIVVMDNLCVHKNKRVERLIEEAGCELVLLPPYSPDLNPIEQAFSKVKGALRKTEVRTRDALVEVMGQALDAVTAKLTSDTGFKDTEVSGG